MIYQKHFFISILFEIVPCLHNVFLNVYVLQWGGIILNYASDFSGQKEKLANAFNIKEHFEVSLYTVRDLIIHCNKWNVAR